MKIACHVILVAEGGELDKKERAMLDFLTLSVIYGFFLGISLAFNYMQWSDLKEFEESFTEISSSVELLEDETAVLEPYRGFELRNYLDTFEVNMDQLENEARNGNYPAGQTFDEATLPYLYKFYIASNLGYLGKEEVFELVKRAKRFHENWRHTYADSDFAINALYYQLMREIHSTPKSVPTPTPQGDRA